MSQHRLQDHNAYTIAPIQCAPTTVTTGGEYEISVADPIDESMSFNRYKFVSFRKPKYPNVYTIEPTQCATATTVATGLEEGTYIRNVVSAEILSRRPKWLPSLIRQYQLGYADLKEKDDILSLIGKSETAFQERLIVKTITDFSEPTQTELQEAQLTNIPDRGFCASADIEKITADSYNQMYDPEEFVPPVI